MATSHKRETARRKPRAALIAGPLAVLATGAAVTVGVLGAGPTENLRAVDPSQAAAGIAGASSPKSETANEQAQGGDRLPTVSRAGERPALVPLSRAEQLVAEDAVADAVRDAEQKRWTTAALNLWTLPADGKNVGELESATKVLVTGRSYGGRVEVVVDGAARWVTQGYLADEKPVGAGAGLSMEPCPDSSVENGLTDAAIYVYRSVCNAFPQVTSYGGLRGTGEHTTGRAIDIMTSDKALGDAIAEFLVANAGEFGLYDVIWWQQIWTQQRSGEGWRAMENRGSATANHYDHVHVAVY